MTHTAFSRHSKTLLATAATLSTISLLAGCGLPTADSSVTPAEAPAETASVAPAQASTGETSTAPESQDIETENVAAAMTENHDYWTPDGAVAAQDGQDISLDGDTASSQSDAVIIESSTVTITAAGTYRVSGNLAGQIVVAAGEEDQVTLVLDDAIITNDAGSGILLSSADGVHIQLAEGSANAVSDAQSSAQDTESDAAIFADTDLQISGDGALEVTGRGGDGIASRKDLVISSGDITVTAAGHGLRGKDALVVAGGTLAVDAGGDALRSNNDDDADRGYVLITGGTLDLTAAQDGVDAATDLLISGGNLTVESGGGASATAPEDVSSKGLKAGALLVVEGGETVLDAADDALHSDGSIQLSAGTVTAASGDDGVHAEHTLTIDGASITVTESYEGLEASYLFIEDGEVDITAEDDGLNASFNADSEVSDAAAAGEGPDSDPGTGFSGIGGEMGDDGSELIISGGTLTVDAEGDGIDSNGTLSITGGSTKVFGTTRGGNGAFDANGEFSIDGGTVIGTSVGSMEQTPGSGEQGWVAVTVPGLGSETAAVSDSAGEELGGVSPTKDYGYVFYSDPSVIAGETYGVETDQGSGEAVAGEAPADGMGGMGGAMNGAMPGAPDAVAPRENGFEQ